MNCWRTDDGQQTTDDRRRTKSDDNSSHGLKARWAKKVFLIIKLYSFLLNKNRAPYKNTITFLFKFCMYRYSVQIHNGSGDHQQHDKSDFVSMNKCSDYMTFYPITKTDHYQNRPLPKWTTLRRTITKADHQKKICIARIFI